MPATLDRCCLSCAAALILGALGACSGRIGDSPAQPDAQSVPSDASIADADPCEGLPLETWYADMDGDSFGDPSSAVQSCTPLTDGYVQQAGDCEDGLDSVHPDAVEICGDGLDNDCAGGDPCGNNLVAHWRFDQTQGVVAVDSTGHGHDGVLIDGPSWNGPGTALVFDGVDDYVVVEHAPDLLLEQGTVALWFRTDNSQVTQGIWSKDSSGFDTGGHLSIYVNYNATDGTSAIRARLQDTAASYVVSKAGVEQGTWYHVVVTFGAGGLRLRVNNQLAASSAYTGGLGSNSGGAGNFEPLVIGGHTALSDDLMPTPMTNPLDGTIHDVQIYNRALLPAEISDIYDVSRP